MRTFSCVCGAMLFFENSRCLTCGREVGWCPNCDDLTAIEPDNLAEGIYRCSNPRCAGRLGKCRNYSEHDVCNRCVIVRDDGTRDEFCDYCRFNDTIPDLSVAGHLQRWYQLEQAKRRLFYQLDFLGLPYGNAADGVSPPLAFDFKADVIPAANRWHSMGETEQVYTGHAGGRITINIREADDVEREKTRVEMGERLRTLIGHFRHEIGHYYWSLLVENDADSLGRFVAQFGDHQAVPYGEALEKYYRDGPPADWQGRYVTAYASMHPWEDWAETFATYLDMASVLDTAFELGLPGPTVTTEADLEVLVAHFQRLGVFMNEMNRAMGLHDYVPKVLGPAVRAKMALVHELVRKAGRESRAAEVRQRAEVEPVVVVQ